MKRTGTELAVQNLQLIEEIFDLQGRLGEYAGTWAVDNLMEANRVTLRNIKFSIIKMLKSIEEWERKHSKTITQKQ